MNNILGIQGWSVSVEVDAETILTIGHNSLSGIDDFTDAQAQVIRNCGEHLLAFIGSPRATPTPLADAAAIAERPMYVFLVPGDVIQATDERYSAEYCKWKPIAPLYVGTTVEASTRPVRRAIPARAALATTEAPDAIAPEAKTGCSCETCRPLTMTDMRMVLCETCGNKRCPHATNHCNACTGSNEVGQKGSSWEHVKTDAIAPTEGEWIAHWAGSNPYKGWSIRQGRDEVIWFGEGISSETVEAIVLAHNKCFDCEGTVCVMNCSGRAPSPEAPAVDARLNLQDVFNELRKDFNLKDSGKALKAVERAIAIAAKPAVDAPTLTKEQRETIEWAAGRAHVAALGKPMDGVEGQRWRVLTELLRAVPEQLSTKPMAAQPISDAMMDLVDRLGSEAKDVDPRAWQHLLVYAPKPAVNALTADDVVAALPKECAKVYGDYEKGYNKALGHIAEKIRALLADRGSEGKHK